MKINDNFVSGVPSIRVFARSFNLDSCVAFSLRAFEWNAKVCETTGLPAWKTFFRGVPAPLDNSVLGNKLFVEAVIYKLRARSRWAAGGVWKPFQDFS